MSYLDRLKRRISASSVEPEGTKVSKAPFVPFVTGLRDQSRQIPAASDPPIGEIFLTDAWRYGSAESLQHIARQLDMELFEERAGVLEFDGGYTRADAELCAALDVVKAKGH